MIKLWRWVIVVICSPSSLCVCVMYPRIELSAPMIVHTASQFVGPEVGPLIEGVCRELCIPNLKRNETLTWSCTIVIDC